MQKICSVSKEDFTETGKMILVPKERLELSHPCGYWILSPARLPFHHFGTLQEGEKELA